MSNLSDIIFGLTTIIYGGKLLSKGLSSKKNLPYESFSAIESPQPKTQIHEVNTLEERIGYIKKMLNKGVEDGSFRAKAAQIVSQRCGKQFCVKERDDLGEINILFTEYRRYIRYTADIKGIDTFQSPQQTLKIKIGDCDDAAITLGALFKSIGFDVAARAIMTKGSDDYDHIYLLVGVPKRNAQKWIPVDATVDKPVGWQPPSSMIAKHQDFLL